MRLPSKDEQSTRKNQKSEQKKPYSEPESDSLTEVKQMLKTLAGKVEEIQKGSTVPSNQKPLKSTNDYSGVTCYGCGERGHIWRRCPQKQGAQRQRKSTNRAMPNQGRVEGSNKKSNPLNCERLFLRAAGKPKYKTMAINRWKVIKLKYHRVRQW